MAAFNNKAPAINMFGVDHNMSVYIPRVDTRSLPRGNRHAEAQYQAMAEEFIAKQFHFQRIGNVERVDLLKKQTAQGFDYFIAFVHFEKWYDTQQAKDLQDQISTDGTKAKLQFHENWYWIVNENKTPLTKTEAALHKTIYDQAKQIGMLEQAVVYLRNMKNVESHIAEPALLETAQKGFGYSWNDELIHMNEDVFSSPPSMTMDNYPALNQDDGPLHLPPTQMMEEGEILTPPALIRLTNEHSLAPPALTRSLTGHGVNWSHEESSPSHPSSLLRTASTGHSVRKLSPKDLFGDKASDSWPLQDNSGSV
jgi:hypothetical protein